ncbi:MAG: Putative membrane transport protein [uncultured Nocardioides sp.]|uniref:Membrane transport protein n=1 Tax=uncultured Nocardioides sp. TaxID=198441 RepID=A0A6J4NAQ1_9ACTN|nr:MAG: Putative membrane transport protein [uncultured Nocardioides sp.]
MTTTDPAPRPRLIDKAKPPSVLAGRLSTQSLLFALGEGTFMTGSAVFFTQVVGLTVVQVGLGLTIAGIAGFVAAYPMGKLVDRIGPKRCWSISSAGQASMFAVWPFIDSFQGYIAMAVVMEVIGALGGTAHGAYTIDVLPAGERVTSRAYMYSALNVGFTLGSLVGGIALAFESITLLTAVPWFTAAVFMVNAVAVTRLPDASHDLKTADERKVKLPGPGPMRNLGWLAAMFFSGTLWTNQVILNLVIPLWLVEKTDAPWVVLAFLFGTNTVMCIFLPLAAARGIKDNATALRAIRLSTVFFIVSCVITLSTHHSVGLWTVLLFFLGHVTLTGAELYLSAASWTFEAELMDPRRRGEYQGAAELSSTLGRVWAPALYTFLAMSWGSTGWLVIAGIITLGAAGLHPSVAMARRFLEEHVPADVLADASASEDPEGPDDLAPVGPPTVEQPAEPGGVSPLSQSTGGNTV